MSVQYPTNEAEFRTFCIMRFEQIVTEIRAVKEAHERELDFLKSELFGNGQPGRLGTVEAELSTFREKVSSLTGKVLMLTLFVSVIILGLQAFLK